MPTVRSIGNPVPGAPADASGLGGIAPWMSEGQLSQPGQAGLSSGEPHPFASELAAALAAKQGKSETQAASAPKPAQNSGQNLPKQVGTQRDALAKFAEKESNAASSGQNSSAAEPAEASGDSAADEFCPDDAAFDSFSANFAKASRWVPTCFGRFCPEICAGFVAAGACWFSPFSCLAANAAANSVAKG